MVNRIPTYSLALILAGLALLIPPEMLAVQLTGGTVKYLPTIVTSLWWLKLILLVTAGLVWLLPSRLKGPGGAGPVYAHGIRADTEWARSDLFLVLALMIAAAAFRFISLGEGLWLDEYYTLVNYVRLSAGQILAHYDSKNHHILFSLLAHGSVTAFGESAWALRLPAALLGILSIPVLYLFGRLIAPRAEAFLAAAFLAASYHHVWFSQNARGYTGLLLGAVLASYLFLKLLSADRIRPVLVLGYAATAAFSVWIHFTGAVIIAAHGIIWFLISVRPRVLRVPPAKLTIVLALTLAVLFSLVLYGPVLLQMADTLSGQVTLRKSADWKKPSWFVLETLRNLGRGAPGGWLSIVPAAFIFLLGIRSYARQSWLVLGVLMVPAVLVAVVILGTGQNLWPRLFFFSAGFFILIAVRGGATVVTWKAPEAKASRWVLALGMVVVLASASTVPRAWAPKQDFEGAIRFLANETGTDDAVVAVDLVNFPLKRFHGRDWPSRNSADALSEIEAGHSRTFVLYTFPIRLAAKHPALWAKLRSEYRTAAVFPGTIGGGNIIILVKP
jgi:uncharacterized membrane protein